MALSAKHEKFCREYLVDLNATQAYIRTYPDVSQKSAEASGPRLLGDVRVKERIAELKEEYRKNNEISVEWVLNGLKKEALREGEDATHSARVAAFNLLGKHLGMFEDRLKVENVTPPAGPVEITFEVVTVDVVSQPPLPVLRQTA
jgi:phage terminase small subunit